MRVGLVAAVFTIAIASSPAFAAGANQSGSGADQNSPSSGAVAAPSASHMQTQAALKKSLEQSGFKNIRIAAEAYVVHAQGPDGAPVVMMITPDSVTGVIANRQTASAPSDLDQNQKSGSASQPSAGSGSNSQQ